MNINAADVTNDYAQRQIDALVIRTLPHAHDVWHHICKQEISKMEAAGLPEISLFAIVEYPLSIFLRAEFEKCGFKVSKFLEHFEVNWEGACYGVAKEFWERFKHARARLYVDDILKKMVSDPDSVILSGSEEAIKEMKSKGYIVRELSGGLNWGRPPSCVVSIPMTPMEHLQSEIQCQSVSSGDESSTTDGLGDNGDLPANSTNTTGIRTDPECSTKETSLFPPPLLTVDMLS